MDSVTTAAAAPLSLDVHIPFCESVCYHCACNKVITRHHERSAEYLEALELDIELHVAALGGGQPLSQLHLRGGSPTFLGDDELTRLMTALRGAFRIGQGAEVSIEVDPRTVTPDRLRHLASLGFNRLSFGVQDVDADVQKAVHRVQSLDSVATLLKSALELGFQSTNVDLIYGLPKQTPQSLARTVAQVAQLRTERIDAEALPLAQDKVRMLAAAIAGFIGHGYSYIGMDHVALPEDSLAVAKRQGRVEFESIELAYLVDMRRYFAAEIERLRELERSGLVVVEPDAIRVTPLGWYFVRAAAMVFDKHLHHDQVRKRFSRIV